MKRAFSSGRRVAPGPAKLNSDDAVGILAALAQTWRLEVFRLLVRYLPYGLAAGDIARLVALPHNTLSTHLAILEQAGLVRSRREGRSIIFAAVRDRADELAVFLSEDCCSPTAGGCEPIASHPSQLFPVRREIVAPTKVRNVLVLCTGNSARSILAEAILNREGAGRFHAFSAGTRPKPTPDPECITLLDGLGYDTAEFRSKSWQEFAGADAPPMDMILTVCDSAASEAIPNWPGDPLVAHWGISDPDAAKGAESAKRAAFVEAYRRLSARISSLVNLDLENFDPLTLARHLCAIGAMEGATEMAIQRWKA
jgi:ArsR family transcriptional regulator, arsenate/arsenite/antimonite-responsive transcriptional repressor / arsenate reductase (thioredoxin)